MSSIIQSAAWWCFAPNRLSPENFVRVAKEAGYTAIDLVPEAYWPMVTDSGLVISAIGGHGSIISGLNRRDQHSRIEQELLNNIAHAVKWKIPNLICFSGSREGLSDEEGADITVEGLKRIAPAAEAAGITLILELLNSKVDHPDYQCDHTAWGVEVINRVASPNVKLLYDIYHMQIMEGDIIRTIGQSHTAFAHYHTAGNPGRHDLDEAQEIFYPPILQAIVETGYSGYIAHEFVPKGDPVAALRDTFAMCAKYLS